MSITIPFSALTVLLMLFVHAKANNMYCCSMADPNSYYCQIGAEVCKKDAPASNTMPVNGFNGAAVQMVIAQIQAGVAQLVAAEAARSKPSLNNERPKVQFRLTLTGGEAGCSSFNKTVKCMSGRFDIGDQATCERDYAKLREVITFPKGTFVLAKTAGSMNCLQNNVSVEEFFDKMGSSWDESGIMPVAEPSSPCLPKVIAVSTPASTNMEEFVVSFLYPIEIESSATIIARRADPLGSRWHFSAVPALVTSDQPTRSEPPAGGAGAVEEPPTEPPKVRGEKPTK